MNKLLNNRYLIIYIIPFIIGSLTVFSFQPFNFTLINFFVLPIFFYFIVYIKKKSKSVYRKKPYKLNLFLFGLSFGFGFYLSGIHWISHSLTFDENFKILIPFALILIPLFLSLFFSLVTCFIGPLLSYDLRSIFILAGALAFSDFLRAKILTGFPWNLWAYSFSSYTEIIQILDVSGLYLFNLISISVFMLPTIVFFNIKLVKKLLLLSLLGFFVFGLYIYGNHTLNQNKTIIKSQKEKIYIKVVSPNFKLEYGISLDQIKKRLQDLIKYSDIQDKKKTLIIWPEGVFSGYSYNDLKQFENLFSSHFNKNHLILFGINMSGKDKEGFYNSLIVVNNNFEIIKEYKKQKLVPFGEFLPFEKILKNFGLKKITEGHISFLKGDKQENLKIDKLNILPLICYEVIFTKLVQKSDDNTNLIINISEDGWFGNSLGPHQHFAKAIYRAIESNSFLIRSANKGISAIIDNKGNVVKRIDSNEVGNIELEVPLIKSQNRNKNDLIFFILLITYVLIFNLKKKNNVKK